MITVKNSNSNNILSDSRTWGHAMNHSNLIKNRKETFGKTLLQDMYYMKSDIVLFECGL